MSQFDIHHNVGKLKNQIPFLLDIQSDLVSLGLVTTLVVPLYRAELIPTPALKIHVPLTIRRVKCLALFDELTSIARGKLGQQVITVDAADTLKMKAALDCMFFNQP